MLGVAGLSLIKRAVFIILWTGIALFTLVWTWIYFRQEALIFPGLALPKSKGYYELLPGVTALTFQTADGETLQAFTSFDSNNPAPYVGLIFHGNGESAELQNFIPFFRNVGIPAFTFDYRGYGDSTGYPTEAGIYLDAEAAAAQVQKITGLPYSQFLILGNSIGSGPAAYLAQKIQPRGLILIAGYADFRELVERQPFYRLFISALRYQFPVANYLQKLTNQCVVLAHGKRDELIPFDNLAKLASALPPIIKPTLLMSDIATHNDVFYKVEDSLIEATKACL